MQPRSSLILDAAIRVVGTDGIRALTHRAVDAAAGLPAGSTSNLFRTRDALMHGLASHMVTTELAAWDQLAAAAQPSTVDELADVLASTVAALVGPMRTLTVARYALFLEAARDPALQAEIARTGARVAAIGMEWLSVVGSRDPARHAQLLMAHLDGLILHELALPQPDLHIAAQLSALLHALLRS